MADIRIVNPFGLSGSWVDENGNIYIYIYIYIYKSITKVYANPRQIG